ncbi:MAG: hypothetical protein C5B53_04895 [Candidatus Melainabacteria bacterium]|nr:MAG: hypothetical protein C5B53_04895 [Candidatus Melainabacteria bacterium]
MPTQPLESKPYYRHHKPSENKVLVIWKTWAIYELHLDRRPGIRKKFNEIKMNDKITQSFGQMKIMHASNRTLTTAPISLAFALIANFSFAQFALCEPVSANPHSKGAGQHEASEKPQEKTPEPPIENVVNVSTNELVDKAHDYVGKNIKFNAKFFAFSSLALDYKPALRPSKSYLSFLVLRPEAHIPYSEIKLAMPIPKEKDPESQVLTSLKDGDEVEVIGKVFATPMDEPWVDVLRLKKLSSAEDDKKDKKISSSSGDSDKGTANPPSGILVKPKEGAPVKEHTGE